MVDLLCQTSFLLLVNCPDTGFLLVMVTDCIYALLLVSSESCSSKYTREAGSCVGGVILATIHIFSRPALSGLFEQKFIHLCEVTC